MLILDGGYYLGDKVITDKEIDHLKISIFLNSSLLLLSLLHIMNLMKNIKTFGTLVTLVESAIVEMKSFMIFFVSFIAGFSLIYQIFGVEVSSMEEDEY
jgi:hypothetical protein